MVLECLLFPQNPGAQQAIQLRDMGNKQPVPIQQAVTLQNLIKDGMSDFAGTAMNLYNSSSPATFYGGLGALLAGGLGGILWKFYLSYRKKRDEEEAREQEAEERRERYQQEAEHRRKLEEALLKKPTT